MLGSDTGLGGDLAGLDRLGQGVVIAFVLVGVASANSRARGRKTSPFRDRRRWRSDRPSGRERGPAPRRNLGVVRMPRGASPRRPPTPSSPRAGGRSSRGGPVLVPRSQPRKTSLAACISRCPSTTRRPWLSNSALAGEEARARTLALPSLQEQRVVTVAAQEQHDPGARADAADADDLAREVDVAIAVEQVAAVRPRRAPVASDQIADRVSSAARRPRRRARRSGRSGAGRSTIAARRRRAR